jgi:putative phosphoesterase
MKIALLSDIHGNYPALKAVLNDIKQQRPDRIVVLGDIVFKGPQPELCVEAVRSLNVPVIRGNIDELVGTGKIQPGFAKSPEHEAALLREMAWTRGRLSEEQLRYLAELPFLHDEQLTDGLKLRCVHANPQNILDNILPDAPLDQFERMFEGTDAQVVAYAHIHQPYVRTIQGRTLLNTGSVGLPFDGDPRCSYAIIEATGDARSITLRRVSYDIEETVRAYDGSGHPFADSVIAAIRSGQAPR